MSLKHFKHIHIDNQAPQNLFLFHGTGADEHDLLPLVDHLQDSYNFISLRGNITEHGMNRFFARTAPGVFDQQSIQTESQKVAEFIASWPESKPAAFLGYSNGANIILATLFHHPQAITRAVLLHPMLPFHPKNIKLNNHNFLVTYGQTDTMITADQSRQVITSLQNLGATVQETHHPGGHEIRPTEIDSLTQFLKT